MNTNNTNNTNFFLNTDYYWTRISRITRIFFEHGLLLNTNITNNTNIFLNTDCYWTRISRITRIFFDWKYCEAIKIRVIRVIRVQKKFVLSCSIFSSCSKKFVLFVLFVFKKNRSFRVLMTWLWCLSHRKARNVQKRISGKSGCCIFVASIRHNVVH